MQRSVNLVDLVKSFHTSIYMYLLFPCKSRLRYSRDRASQRLELGSDLILVLEFQSFASSAEAWIRGSEGNRSFHRPFGAAGGGARPAGRPAVPRPPPDRAQAAPPAAKRRGGSQSCAATACRPLYAARLEPAASLAQVAVWLGREPSVKIK